MTRLSADDLRLRTLARQFPAIGATDTAGVLRLFEQLGPIQSQVPRAPFVAASSRLPGASYATISELFESYALVKGSSLRGTVHTCVAAQFGRIDVIARLLRRNQMRSWLKLRNVTPDEVMTVVEAYAAETWRDRDDLAAHVRGWLAEHEPRSAAALGDTVNDGVLWGHSALIRRPRDGRWERRTDTLHRLAAPLVGPAEPLDFDTALADAVRTHLGAYGPVVREDLAFFFGVGLTAVDRAVRRLGDEVVVLAGPERDDYLELACAQDAPAPDLGVRLLAEFDGLLLGFQGRHRDRFCTAEQLEHIWGKKNGLFSPVVLDGERMVATWKTVTRGRRTGVIFTRLPGTPRLAADRLDGPVNALATALDLTISDVVIS